MFSKEPTQFAVQDGILLDTAVISNDHEWSVKCCHDIVHVCHVFESNVGRYTVFQGLLWGKTLVMLSIVQEFCCLLVKRRGTPYLGIIDGLHDLVQ